MAKAQYERLFSPGRIGTMKLKNRIVYPPMGTNVCTFEGDVTERLKAYHAARAAGGVGLDIVENAAVDTKASGARLPFGLNIDDDRYIPGLKELVDVVHKGGAKACLQLYHGTLWAKPEGREALIALIRQIMPLETQAQEHMADAIKAMQ